MQADAAKMQKSSTSGIFRDLRRRGRQGYGHRRKDPRFHELEAAWDPDDIEMLQDLIVAAVNEALRVADETVAAEMGDRRHEPWILMGVLELIARLAAQFSRLPGIGSKSALRLAYFVVDQPEAEVKALAFALSTQRSAFITVPAWNYTIGELATSAKIRKGPGDPLRRLRPEGYSRP